MKFAGRSSAAHLAKLRLVLSTAVPSQQEERSHIRIEQQTRQHVSIEALDTAVAQQLCREELFVSIT
jgi:hypothetical protein